MAAQTVPAAGNITKIADGFFPDASNRELLETLLFDLYTLRNSVDALTTIFNAHTHKTPTSSPGTTSTATSDAGGSGSTGGTATSMAAVANVTTTVGTSV
jgi:hypothetical protein